MQAEQRGLGVWGLGIKGLGFWVWGIKGLGISV